MKKIFTFLFSISLVSSAFAQNDRHGQYRNQPNENRNQSSNYSKDNNGYNQNYQDYNRNNENGYGYNNERGSNDRSICDKNIDRGFNSYPEYNHDRMYNNDRRFENDRYNRSHAWFKIRFGRHERW